MNVLAKGITDILCENGTVNQQDAEACIYGIEVFLISIIEVLSILIFSAFIGNFTQTLLMFFAFIPLRVYAGGYHADTRVRCYFVSVGVYILFTIIMIKFIDYITPLVCFINCIFTLASVMKFAPVIHHNKSVVDREAKHYKKMSIIICDVEICLIFILLFLNVNKKVYIPIVLGQLSVVMSMYAAMIKNKIFDNK
jgi:accessory gene regulator B